MSPLALTDPTNLTMTSREIAHLTAKEHKHVLADVRGMLEGLGLRSADFSSDLPDGYGRLQPAFVLPKRETLILVSGYSVSMRAKIIDRWQELEAQSPAIPKTFAQALLLAAQQQEEIERQQAALEVAKPKVEYADALLNADDTTLVRDAAKALGVRVRELEAALKMKGVILPNNAPAAQYVNKGYFKESIHPYETKTRGMQIGVTARVTGRGIEFIRRFIVRNISLFPKSNHRGATQ